MAQRYNPYKGKWTIKRLLKSEIEYNGGGMPVEVLLNHMSKQGYLKEALRRNLEALNVEVMDGWARVRT